MVVVHVQHFLNEEGQRLFANWIKEVDQVLQSFRGFKSIRQLEALDDSAECHLLLEFESMELLGEWASSASHDKLVEKLTPYRLKAYQSRAFLAKES